MPPTVNDKTTANWDCVFVDAAGATIVSSAVSAIAATLRDVPSGKVINGRLDQNVLNTNGGTLGASGFTLVLSSTDNAAVAGSGVNQVRRLTLKVTYTSGVLTMEYPYVVRALEDIA